MSLPVPVIIEDEYDLFSSTATAAGFADGRAEQIVEPPSSPVVIQDNEDDNAQQPPLTKDDQIILAFLRKADVADIYDPRSLEKGGTTSTATTSSQRAEPTAALATKSTWKQTARGDKNPSKIIIN